MFGVSSYWRNDLRGKFRCTEACSAAHHSCLNQRENCSLLEQLPSPTSSPQAAGLQSCQQPVPLRLRQWLLPWLKAFARWAAQEAGPHPLESPSAQVRFGYEKKEYGKARMATSPRTIPSPNSWRLHPQSRLAKGGGLTIQRRAGDLILCNSAQSLAESCGTEHGT